MPTCHISFATPATFVTWVQPPPYGHSLGPFFGMGLFFARPALALVRREPHKDRMGHSHK